MRRQKNLGQAILGLIRQSMRTRHGQFVLGGLLVGLCYLPVWLGYALVWTVKGTSDLLIVVALSYLGLHQLRKQRHQLKTIVAPSEDRLLGHMLILCGVMLFPFCRFAVWSQAMTWLLVLIGIACSTWGMSFFVKYPLPTSLLLLSLHPTPTIIAGSVWRAISPSNLIEQFMAMGGTSVLQTIGQPAVANGKYIVLPTGGVEVGWGCNGFDMAFTMAATGLILGLWFQQSWFKIVLLISAGICLALLFNIPRIVLLTFAAVYWGENAFEFWHGSIGGQIFSTVLFTVYYYAAMAVLNRQPGRSNLRR